LKAFTLTYGQVKPGIRVHYDCGFGLHDIIVGQTNRPFLHREEKVSLSSDLAKTLNWRKGMRPKVSAAKIADTENGPLLCPVTGASKKALVLVDSYLNSPCSCQITMAGSGKPEIIASGCTNHRPSVEHQKVLF
jgi:hypothetical protein